MLKEYMFQVLPTGGTNFLSLTHHQEKRPKIIVSLPHSNARENFAQRERESSGFLPYFEL
jgi:hypothetical protein